MVLCVLLLGSCSRGPLVGIQRAKMRLLFLLSGSCTWRVLATPLSRHMCGNVLCYSASCSCPRMPHAGVTCLLELSTTSLHIKTQGPGLRQGRQPTVSLTRPRPRRTRPTFLSPPCRTSPSTPSPPWPRHPRRRLLLDSRCSRAGSDQD